MPSLRANHREARQTGLSRTQAVVRASRARTVAWVGLIVGELLAVSITHLASPGWLDPFIYFRVVGLWGMASAAAFALLMWPRLTVLLDTWRTAQARHDWRLPLGANLLTFALLLAATRGLAARISGGELPDDPTLAAYDTLLAVTIVLLFRIDISLRDLWRTVTTWRLHALLALAAGLFVQVMAYAAQSEWSTLAGVTLAVVQWILSHYETGVVVDVLERTVRLGDFEVAIAPNCSGYEGIGLTIAFLTVYIATFRERLRFPQIFLLFPVAIISIWLLNALRIAALVSVGAHISPQAAIHGFHSQAGWIAFLGVTLGIIGVATRATYFARRDASQSAIADKDILAMLVPFVAMMLASMLVSATAPLDKPFYVLKAAVIAAVLWHFRRTYRSLDWRLSIEAPVAGVLVGAAWIATNPLPPTGVTLSEWTGLSGAGVAGVWFAVRALGSIVLVPAAEELAFRGFLYRRLIAADFEAVPWRTLSWMALVVSSLVFGLLHDRWLAASLSGVVFALVMLRTGRLSQAFVAHASANASLCAWAITFGDWSLL